MSRTTKVIIVLSILILGSGGGAAAVFAQGNTWVGSSLIRVVETAPWRLGFLRINAAVELLNSGYDSDVYYGYLEEASPDLTLTAGLPIQIWAPLSKKVVLEFTDNPQYLFFLDTRRERAFNNSFAGNIHFAFERFYLRGGGSLSNVRRRLSPELDINVRERVDSVNGLALWQSSRKASLAVIYEGASYDYGDAEFGGASISETLNRTEHSIDLVAYIQATPRLRLFTNGQYGRYDFPAGLPLERDARSLGIYAGFEFTPREGEVLSLARIDGRVSLGYIRLEMDSPSIRDAAGISGEVNLSAMPLRRTTVRAVFSRGFQFSVFSGTNYYLQTTYGGGVSRQLSNRISLSYDLVFGGSEYPEAEDGEGPVPGYRYRTHSAVLSIGLAPRLTLSLIGTLGRRTIVQTDSTRNRNFFGFNLVYGAPIGRVAVPMAALSR